MSAIQVAALYVERGGVYWDLSGVDPWDEARDARLYAGPWPVVAHPPCKRWGSFAKANETRYGYIVGDDGGCFGKALAAVRTYGGVLEHPAGSLAFYAHDLPIPNLISGWTGGFDGGWSAYVEQGRYGHKVKKATWLYAFGVELAALEWGLQPDSEPGDYARWSRIRYPGDDERPRMERSWNEKTPLAFRDMLLDMARSARVSA